MGKKIKKQIFFNETQLEIIEKMKKTMPGINTLADAVRYAVLSMDEKTNQAKEFNEVKKKINVMAKNIDIITEMVSGGFHEQGVKAIGNSEDTYIYMDAKKNVENSIQRSTTLRSNLKKSNFIKNDEKVTKEEKQEVKTTPSFSRIFT